MERLLVKCTKCSLLDYDCKKHMEAFSRCNGVLWQVW